MRMRLLVLFVTLVTAAGCGPDTSTPVRGGGTPGVVSTYVSPASTGSPTPSATPSPTPSPTPAAVLTTPAQAATTGGSGGGQGGGDCGADYYRNVDGNCVHRPVPADGPPAGATAKCNDGTYSFSQHRSGTCSHHGGVAIWY